MGLGILCSPSPEQQLFFSLYCIFRKSMVYFHLE